MILIAIIGMALIGNAQVNLTLTYDTDPPLYYKDIQEYHIICWNDSTKMVVWKSWEGMGWKETIIEEGERPFNCESYPTNEILYIHKQPTFIGFIDFLNKKYTK